MKLIHIILPILTFAIANTSYGQNISTIVENNEVPFTVYVTDDSNISIDSVLNPKTIFKPTNAFLRNTHPNKTYWLKVDFINDLKTIKKDSVWQLSIRNFELASLFSEQHGKITEKKFGRFNINKDEYSIVPKFEVNFKSNSLIQNRYLYLKLKHTTAIEHLPHWHITYGNSANYETNKILYSFKDIKTLIPLYVFAGISFVVFLITITFFFYSNRYEFLFYALYVLFLFLFLTMDVFRILDLLKDLFDLKSYAIVQITPVICNIFYTFFIIYYLNTKNDYPNLYKGLKLLVYINCIIFFLDLIFLIVDFFLGHIYLLMFQRIITAIFCIIGMLYLSFKTKTKLSYFVIVGTFFYLVGAFSLFFANSHPGMIYGASLELLIFSFGLAYKRQLEYDEKIMYQKESFANKSKALRAQINPHFIFNSLSSIQHLITKNDRVSALKYLSKFSHLTRNILEGSIETNVLLTDEIKLLNDYLELESLRFDSSFEYTINVDDTIDINAIEVPALIVQPFVENAIIHGLLNKKSDNKKLTVRYKKETDFVICEVEDNGIGCQATNNKESIHKSRGVMVTEERLKTLNKSDNNIKNIEIIDKVDNKGKPLGTKVIIRIPI